MTGVAGNVFTLGVAKQTAKGSPAGTGSGFRMKLTGGDLEPNRQFVVLQETDATRQQGSTVVTGAQVQGTPEWYIRPEEFGLIAYAALGANQDSGGGPYTHTATIAQRPPYLTVRKSIGSGTLIDQYNDCTLGSLELSGAAGQPLMCKADFMGLGVVLGATDSSAAIVSGHVFTYPENCILLGGVDSGKIEQWTLTYNSNAEFIVGDCSLTPYDVVLGRAEVNGSYTTLFENDQDYRRFHSGASNGTSFSTTLFTQSIDIGMTAGTDSIHAVVAGATLTAYPVPLDVSGKPIRVAATWNSLPQPAIQDYLSFLTTNSVASY